MLAHVIHSSDRTVFLCNWDSLAQGERERSLTFLEPVLQVALQLQAAVAVCCVLVDTQSF